MGNMLAHSARRRPKGYYLSSRGDTVSDKRWKAVEREHAKDLGVERIPVSGRQRDEGGADFADALCAYQCKHGQRQPSYLLRWLNGIKGWTERHRKIASQDLIPVVVWRGTRQRKEDAIVMLKWSDWVALYGDSNDKP